MNFNLTWRSWSFLHDVFKHCCNFYSTNTTSFEMLSTFKSILMSKYLFRNCSKRKFNSRRTKRSLCESRSMIERMNVTFIAYFNNAIQARSTIVLLFEIDVTTSTNIAMTNQHQDLNEENVFYIMNFIKLEIANYFENSES